MAVRKRYYTWLARAYLKKWKRTILLSTLIGIVGFFLLVTSVNYLIIPSLTNKIETVGLTGTYTLSSPPEDVFSDVSYGLTRIDEDGQIHPAAAQRWEIEDGGKKYIFHLRQEQYFHDGTPLTAHNIPLSFEEAEKEAVDDLTIVYTLENEYSPFLSSVSKPILTPDLEGLGDFKITDVELNASFIKSITTEKIDDPTKKIKYYFYPTDQSLKTAFALGEVDKAINLQDTSYNGSDINSWENAQIEKGYSYKEMVALFYDNTHEVLSEKEVRQALDLAIPQEFLNGQRADGPIPPTSIYYQKNANYLEGDLEIAQELLDGSNAPDNPNFEITTTEEFEEVAEKIQKNWEKIGVTTTLKIVKNQPSEFQMYITKYKIPKDPDQYTIWHSDQRNNIIGYKNLRIDKLLEDGRIVSDIEERKDIYADFQKYLTDDTPASFLYFPASYTVSRK